MNGLSNGIWPKLGFHTTVSYSKEPFKYPIRDLPKHPIGFAAARNIKLFGTSLVLTYSSEYLNIMHNLTMLNGATYDYPKYIPHITIIEDCKSIPLIKEVLIPIILSEIFYIEWKENHG